MNHDLDASGWLTEACEDGGSAFSFQLAGTAAKLHEEQTEFQKIEVWDTVKFGKVMLIDGYIMLSTRDNFLYHEMMTHPALFLHPNPKRVVIIGGGDCGSLREVLKHDSVESACQIDIDAGVTRAALKYFPELCESNDDPRAELLFIDGLKWMREAAPGSVDVIIVDSTDPIGPAEGLFGKAFFTDCHRALAEDGLLVQQSESPLYHVELMRAMRKAMREGGFVDFHTLNFPQPVYPSGWWSATVAGKQALPKRLREEAAQPGFATDYFTAEIANAALVMPPFLRRALAS